MPQITLHIDKKTLEQVRRAAQAERVSLSRWVENQLKSAIHSGLPDDYERLFGSAHDIDHVIPTPESGK